MSFVRFLNILLKGIGQVMLQNSTVTGLLFLIGISFNSWLMGIGAFIGTLTSTFTSFMLKYPKEDIDNGLYGFNGTLVGIALLYFFKVNILLIIFIVLGSSLSSVIMYFMSKKKLAPYTFPFIISTWILIAAIELFQLAFPLAQNSISKDGLDIISSLSMGLSQVMFQENITTGVIFFLGILFSSRKSAVYALIGSLVGMGIAYLFSFQLNLINVGAFGFNAVLCGVAFSNEGKYSLLHAIFSITISIFITQGIVTLGGIGLTFPFVLATWVTIGVKKVVCSKFTAISS